MSRLVSIAFAVTLLAWSSLCSGERADDAKMAQDALGPFVDSSLGVTERNARIVEIHSRLSDLSVQNPTQQLTAVIIFERGISVPELSKFARRYKLEVIDFHLKAPLNDTGVVQSIDVGSATLLRFPGEFEERAEKAVGIIRYKMLERSRAIPEAERQPYVDIVYEPLYIYRCVSAATAQDLSDARNADLVAVIVSNDVDKSAQEIAAHRAMREYADQVWREFESRKQ